MILPLHEAELKLVVPHLLFSNLSPVSKGAPGDSGEDQALLVNQALGVCISPFTVQTRETGLWEVPEDVLKSVLRFPLSAPSARTPAGCQGACTWSQADSDSVCLTLSSACCLS